MFIGDYQNHILDSIFGDDHSSRFPSTVYLGIGSDGVGEVTGDGYARIPISNNSTNFPDATGGTKTNGDDFAFDEALESWGTVDMWFIFSADTGFDVICGNLLSDPKTINTGDIASFPTGTLSFTFIDPEA